MESKILRVRGDSPVRNHATALVGFLRDDFNPELHAVGAGAVNQSFKIIVQARSEIAREGKELLTRCGFINKEEDGRPIVVAIMRFIIQ